VQRRSYLSLQFLGIPSETLYWILITVWLVSGLTVFYPRTEELLAWKFYRFRPPSALESQRIGPAWWAVCTAAGVDPDRHRVWIYEGPEATAPVPAGNAFAVSSWSVYNLGVSNFSYGSGVAPGSGERETGARQFE